MNKIGILTANLLLFDKISNICESANFHPAKITSLQNLKEFCEQPSETFVLLDLDFPGLNFDQLKEIIGGSRAPKGRFVGFFPHVRTDLKELSRQAGVSVSYPNSYFFSHLAAIIQELTIPPR